MNLCAGREIAGSSPAMTLWRFVIRGLDRRICNHSTLVITGLDPVI
jgi:hypothetical protein